MTILSGRTVSIAAALGLCLGVAASMSTQSAETTTLHVGTWGGSWRDSIDKNISSELTPKGIKVEYVLGNPVDNLAKLIAAKRQGQVPFDAMEGSPELYTEMVKGGLLAKLDYAAIPNSKGLPGWALADHEVTGLLVTDGIAYNTAKFKEAGIEPPRSYNDLKNPKLKGHVAWPDASHTQHWNAVVGLAMENGGSESNMQPAVKAVNEINPVYFYSSSTELATRFASGDIWAAPWHAGWVVRLDRTKVPLAMAYPKFGDKTGAIYPVTQYIVAGTKHMKAAEAWVNAYLAPDAQYAHAKATGSIPINPGARARMLKEGIGGDAMLLTDEQLDHAYQIDWAKLDANAWRQTWSREVKR